MIDLFLAWANHDPRWHSTEFGEIFHADEKSAAVPILSFQFVAKPSR